MNGVNTGIQVRSVEMPAVGKWVLKGYQADADFGDRFTGNIHEERGRNVIVSRGQAVRITADQQYKSLGTIADAAQLTGMLKGNDWNQYHVIGRGPMLMQFLNGRLVAVLINQDARTALSKVFSVFECTLAHHSSWSSGTSGIGSCSG